MAKFGQKVKVLALKGNSSQHISKVHKDCIYSQSFGVPIHLVSKISLILNLSKTDFRVLYIVLL